MAEPLSLAASVAGLVSLGIQVTTGIGKYLDALESRDEELKLAKQQNEALRNTITIIEKAAGKLDQVLPDASAAAKETIKLCKESIDNLETFAAKLEGSDVGTWRSKLKTGKFHYFFDRPKVLQLSTRLSQTESTLQLAAEGLGLSTVADIQQSVTKIRSDVPVLQSGITLVQNQLHAHHQASTQRMVDHAREQQLAVRLQNEYLEKNQEHNATLDDRMATVERTTHVMQAMLALALLNGASDGLSDDGTRSARTVARFAAKPAAFKELCETVSSHSDLEATVHGVIDTQSNWKSPGPSDSRQRSTLSRDSRKTTSCICDRRLQTKTSLEHSQLGSLYWYREVISRGHSPYCPMSKTLAPKKKWRYGMRYTGLMQVIKGAIDITFNMTSGAGGWSVSPGFRYYPIVDATQDPAFRILGIFAQFSYKLERDGFVPDEFITIFQSRAMRKMRWLFDNRKTSPLAVDARNRSLMHVAFDCIGTSQVYRSVLPELVRTLLDNGVQPISHNIMGDAAGFAHIHYGWACFDEAVMIIAEADSEAMPMSTRNHGLKPFRLLSVESIAKMGKSMPLAEAWGCGPLSIAVMQGDKLVAKTLLERCPKAVAERDLLGLTPLHMAIYRNTLPSLPFLLEAADKVGLPRKVDQHQWSILFTALILSRRFCCNSSDFPECTNCNCSDSLEMLLGTGTVLNLHDLGKFSGLSASARAWRVFFSHLKEQREQLRHVALCSKWAIGECLGLMQETSVLDLHASRIYKVLRDNDIEVPVGLVPTAVDTPCVYNLIPKNAQLAEMLFQMGFRDIDFDIEYGDPPLTTSREPAYIYWLIERGADLERQIWPALNDQSKTSGIFSAHFAMFRLGVEMYEDQTFMVSPTIARILPISLTDACSCQCSTGGCTPFIYMLKGYNINYRVSRDLADIDINSVSQSLPLGIIKSLYLSATRFACFECLDLTHTCCDAGGIVLFDHHYKVKDQDEADEIQQEESALLSLLDEMVDEFAGRIAEITGDPAQLQACSRDYWLHYVPGVLEKLNNSQMSEEERRSAEAIGVVWESDTDRRPAAIDRPKKETTEAIFKHILRELDSIGRDE